MAKFRGTFVQTIENVYEFEIEANNKEEATELLLEDPFEYLSNADRVDEEELGVGEVTFK
ncbi:hypothetical protein RHO15_09760 [Utexia brackfieldae]|uniref:hypothetical protein n=1 Tax=Utexia brackfieldae TaxID=3074108 RepID=UPI00370DB2E8